jgi:type II secretory pathway pseudopilin PulG
MPKSQISRGILLDIFCLQRGISLAEAVVALAILGIAGVSFSIALSTGSIAVKENEAGVIAQNLARSQLEYTKSLSYNPGAITYPKVAVPVNYTLSVAVSSLAGADTDIQKVTVTVSRGGQNLLTVADYKVNR